jgi:hypothetical protein
MKRVAGYTMKRGLIMAGLFASLIGLLGCNKEQPQEYKSADIYRDMRKQVFTLAPTKIGLTPSGNNRVWGVLMETGYPEAVATLVMIGDGTVSLYFSNGGGIIGVGQHDGPRKACESFLKEAPKFMSYAQATNEFPLPKQGNTRFYFLTFDGVFTIEAREDDLGNNRLPLSPLFHKGHEVITEARIVDEKMRTRQSNQPAR